MICFQVVEDFVDVPYEVKVPYPVHVPVDQVVHVPHEVERVVFRDVPFERTEVHREVVSAPAKPSPSVNVGLGVGLGKLGGGKFPLFKKPFPLPFKKHF